MLKGSFGSKPWIKKESNEEKEQKEKWHMNVKDQQLGKDKTEGKKGDADKSNNLVESLPIATSQNKEMENSMENFRKRKRNITNNTCVPINSLGEVILYPETKLDESGEESEALERGGTLCDRTLKPWPGWGQQQKRLALHSH